MMAKRNKIAKLIRTIPGNVLAVSSCGWFEFIESIVLYRSYSINVVVVANIK
jgi:hypothetical protein